MVVLKKGASDSKKLARKVKDNFFFFIANSLSTGGHIKVMEKYNSKIHLEIFPTQISKK